MFGQWGQNNNNGQSNQQQQPQSTGFGAFGQPQQPAAGGFGSGQPAQQPASGFGGFATSSSAFGRPATSAAGGGFGSSGFGASTATQPATSGFGAFGQPGGGGGTTQSAFGSTGTSSGGAFGAFGARPASTTFGQPAQPSTSAFGGTPNPQPPGTGTASPQYAAFQEKDTAGATPITQHFQTISAMPAYRNYSLEELRLQDYAQGRKTASQFGPSTSAPSGFGATPASGSGGFGAFGQPQQPQQQPQQPSSGFGAFGQPGGGQGAFGQPAQTSSGFGTTGSAFGQPQQQQQTGAFGQPAASSGGFGSTPAQPSAFGASTTTGTSAFGQPAAAPATGGFGSGGSSFGQQAKPATPFGAFGGGSTSTTGGGFGAFGQSQQQQQQQGQQTGAFGQPAQPASTGFGAFGQPSTSTGAFGQPQATTGAFGQPSQPQENKPAGFGAFGQPSGSTGAFGQPAQPATGAFGQPAQPAAGALTPFGQQQQPQQPQQQSTGAFGAFGSGGGAFGQPKPAGTGAFGAFGQPAQQTQQQQQPQSTGFGAFGSTPSAPAATGSTGTGAFGAFGGGGAFGAGQQQGQNQQAPAATTSSTGFGAFGGGAFGQPKPATGGFGGGFGGAFGQGSAASGTQQTAQPQQQTGQSPFGGLGAFGGSTLGQQAGQQQQQQPAAGTSPFGGGIFGTANKPATGPLGGSAPGFGASTAFGARPPSLFGSQSGQQSTSGTNTAAIDSNNIYGNNSLVSQALNGASLLHLRDEEKKTSSPAPSFSYTMRHLPRATPTISRLRGFSNPPQDFGASGGLGSSGLRASSVGPGESTNAFAPRPAFGGSLSESLASSISRQNSPGISPDAFRPRASVKKLTMPVRVEVDNVKDSGSGRAGSIPPSASGGSASGSKVHWNPGAQHAMNDSPSSGGIFGGNASTSGARRESTPTPAARGVPASAAPAASSTSPVASSALSSSSPDKLKEGDYWTRPTIAELKKRSFVDLSHLENFTVGRIGSGEITFLKPVDLTSLNAIADIPGGVIEFSDRSCVVYVDETLKPPVGEGLNVPARITLEKCWATDRATREFIKDASHPRHKKHLRTLNNKENTTFVSFDIDTGVWVFEVPHFTRYGLDDSDDEGEDYEELPPIRSAPPPKPRAVPPPSLPSPPESRGQSPEDEEIEVDEASASERSASDAEVDNDADVSVENAVPPWSSGTKIDPQRVNVMQASLFSDENGDDTADEPPPAFGSLAASFGPRAATSTSTFQPRFGQDVGMEPAASTGKFVPSKRLWDQQQDLPRDLGSKYADAVIPAAKSVTSGHEGLRVDAGLALGRSFRVSWGPGGTLVHLGRLCGPNAASTSPAHSPTLHISKPVFTSADDNDERDNTLRLLRHQEKNTAIISDQTTGPQAIPNSTLRFRDFARLYSPDDQSHEANVWRLGASLFDEIDLRLKAQLPDEAVRRIQELRRKHAVSDWLQQSVGSSVEQDLRSLPTGAAKVFRLLTGNQIEKATKSALENGDIQLATLLAQIGGDAEFRADVEEQLAKWKEQHIDAHIDESYRRIYGLLAGIVELIPASKSTDPVEKCKDIQVAQSLDWKRALGLHLWYGTPMDSTHREALRSYDKSFPNSAAAPIPWYRELTRYTGRKWDIAASEPEYDALYELIKLDTNPSSSIENALSPRSYSASPLDYRVGWHVATLLRDCLKVRDFGDRRSKDAVSVNASKVTVAFATQLEQQGLWQQAVFVLLHLESAHERALAVQSVLLRNVSRLDPEVQNYLSDSLQIPKSWIAQAKAVRWQYENQPFDAYVMYLEARLPQQAHDVAMSDLAIECVLREDWALLHSLFTLFSPHEINDWAYRGKLYLEFCDCVLRIPVLTTASNSMVLDAVEAAELERLSATVPLLIQTLPTILSDRDNWQHNVCLARMLSKLLELQLPHNTKPSVPGGLVSEATKLNYIQATALRRFSQTLQAVA